MNIVCKVNKSDLKNCANLHVYLLLQYVPPDLCICTFVLEQSLSVRALQEMLAKSGQNSEGVSDGEHTHSHTHMVTHTDVPYTS